MCSGTPGLAQLLDGLQRYATTFDPALVTAADAQKVMADAARAEPTPT